MAKTPKKAIARIVDEDKNGLIQVDKVDVPNTLIENRAQIIDLSKDLGVRFGINRIQVQQPFKIEDEKGPSGAPVFGVANDKFDQIRLVGDGWVDYNNTSGSAIRGDTGISNFDSFLEITFYGTGLNWLVLDQSGTTRSFNVFVDGSASGSSSLLGAGTLQNRDYSTNQIKSLVSGLDLGIHTVRITQNPGNDFANLFFINAFEIVNESSQLAVNQGQTYIDGLSVDHAAENIAFDSIFENEYGTAGTKGGRVSVYIDNIGNVKKDIQWVDATAQYLSNTDHANEEVISKYNIREFGFGRADDISSIPINNPSTRAFTLDDNTTTLKASNCIINNSEKLFANSNGDLFAFTFIGTGLDVIGDMNASEITIDGTLVGKNVDSNGVVVQAKICSGLPYGTHTVVFQRVDANSAGADGISDFIVYQPKKPSIPQNTVELADYNLMADFAHDTTEGNINALSQGVLRRNASREFFYLGAAWSTTLGPFATTANGNRAITTNNDDTAEYTFFGTGVVFQSNLNSSSDFETILDGLILTAANFPSVTVSTSSSLTYNSSTGRTTNVSATSNVTLAIQGLPLGVHTIQFAKKGGTDFQLHNLDVITPIHSVKFNGPFVRQNNLRVGSQAISDKRKFSTKQQPPVSYTEQIGSNNTSGGVTPQPNGKTICPIYVEEGQEGIYEISACMLVTGTVTAGSLHLFLDGKKINTEVTNNRVITSQETTAVVKSTVYLSKGAHFAQIFQQINSGNINVTRTELIFKKIS